MKAIIFDMDGVLVNTEPLHYKCWKEVVKEDGIDLEFNVYNACIWCNEGWAFGHPEGALRESIR